MLKTMFKRLLLLIVTLFLVTGLAFVAFSIIPGALGKDDQIFVGDIDVDLDRGNGACFEPTLFDGLDLSEDQ